MISVMQECICCCSFFFANVLPGYRIFKILYILISYLDILCFCPGIFVAHKTKKRYKERVHQVFGDFFFL